MQFTTAVSALAAATIVSAQAPTGAAPGAPQPPHSEGASGTCPESTASNGGGYTYNSSHPWTWPASHVTSSSIPTSTVKVMSTSTSTSTTTPSTSSWYWNKTSRPLSPVSPITTSTSTSSSISEVWSTTSSSASATPSWGSACWGKCFAQSNISSISEACGDSAATACIKESCSAESYSSYAKWLESCPPISSSSVPVTSSAIWSYPVEATSTSSITTITRTSTSTSVVTSPCSTSLSSAWANNGTWTVKSLTSSTYTITSVVEPTSSWVTSTAAPTTPAPVTTSSPAATSASPSGGPYIGAAAGLSVEGWFAMAVAALIAAAAL